MSEIIQIGELREQVGKDMIHMLGKVLNRMSKHDKIYWILVHAKWDNLQHNLLRTNLVILPVKPTHVLVGTMCIEVDNKIGKATLLWNLPMDAPRPAGIGQEQGTENETIYESAKRSGVIAYG